MYSDVVLSYMTCPSTEDIAIIQKAQIKDTITFPTIIIAMPDILSEVLHLQSGLSL